MELPTGKVKSVFKNGTTFLRELPRDWDITALRTSIHRFFYQMVLPYTTIYAQSLGADATRLGLINSMGMALAGFLGPFTGTMIDRKGSKKVYLFGILMLVVCWLLYGIAQSWTWILVAMGIYWLGFETTSQSCAFICASTLTREKRATAMSFCETFATGLFGMAGPLLGGYLVTRAGGISTESVRPLFYISAAGAAFSFFLVLFFISSSSVRSAADRPGFFQGLSQVFSRSKGLKKYLIVSSLAYLPTGMVIPYTQTFARDVKGADAGVLAIMVAVSAFIPMLLGIPMGKLADTLGRKKALYIAMPLFWVSNLLLVFAPLPGPTGLFLIISGALQGFFNIGMVLTGAMSMELVPREHMSRWIGIQRFFRMLLASIAALLAGILWERFGLQYVFLVVIALDVLIRLPLLISIPETLRK